MRETIDLPRLILRAAVPPSVSSSPVQARPLLIPDTVDDRPMTLVR